MYNPCISVYINVYQCMIRCLPLSILSMVYAAMSNCTINVHPSPKPQACPLAFLVRAATMSFSSSADRFGVRSSVL